MLLTSTENTVATILSKRANSMFYSKHGSCCLSYSNELNYMIAFTQIADSMLEILPVELTC